MKQIQQFSVGKKNALRFSTTTHIPDINVIIVVVFSAIISTVTFVTVASGYVVQRRKFRRKKFRWSGMIRLSTWPTLSNYTRMCVNNDAADAAVIYV